MSKISRFKKATVEHLNQVIDNYWSPEEIRTAKAWVTEYKIHGQSLGRIDCGRCGDTSYKEFLFTDHMMNPGCVYNHTCVKLSDDGYVPIYNGMNLLDRIIREGFSTDVCIVWYPAAGISKFMWAQELWLKKNSKFQHHIA